MNLDNTPGYFHTSAIWFRGDLRLLDNPAVAAALQSNMDAKPVHAIFVLTPAQWDAHDWAPIKADLLCRRLFAFGQECAAKGIQLHVCAGDKFNSVPALLKSFCQQQGINSLHFNYEYPVHEARRDRAVTQELKHYGIEAKGHHGLLLVPPQAIATQTGGYYKMFTPFNKAWREHLRVSFSSQPTPMNWPAAIEVTSTFKSYHDFTNSFDFERNDSSAWPVAEDEVLALLEGYVQGQVQGYHDERDLPALASTSKLSCYWELGVLSPVTAARALSALSMNFPDGLDKGPDTWLTELAWREFYQHLMHHVPRLSWGRAFQEYTERFPWRDNQDDFERWCQGKTGYPIVDAGMRQLTETGYMHNRVRMIVANFLVKDLHLNWRWGEQFFMRHLIDGSFPANNGGWQWSASTGTDAVPYFRVFNPTRQSEKVDPDGSYIRKWVNELKDVPTKYIHEPYSWLKQQGEREYPAPIVVHKQARQTFLDTFKRVKNDF